MNQFFVDNELYLKFMEIDINKIPVLNGDIDKKSFFIIVEKQFRTLARKYHPDYGGSDKDFKFLIKCKSKLCEGDSENKEFSLFIDHNKFKSFDKTTLAATMGTQLFELICSWSNDLNIKPIFKPITSNDEYEWIFKILDTDDQLSLNVQNLSNELAEISHDLYKDDSLSISVCLFVPSKKMVATVFEYDNSIQLTFDDKILIESSNVSDIKKYFSSKDNIKNDLNEIKSKNFKSRKNNVIKSKTSSEAEEKDRKVIEFISNFKIFNTEYNESAADFLDKL